jgi:hypothetical protein
MAECHRGESEPGPRSRRHRSGPERTRIASERAYHFEETWVHDMLVSVTVLAAQLDLESRENAVSLSSSDCWEERSGRLIEP